jgi:outer membrane protein OmpA-like peptidoglycan-associated protein
MITISRSDYTEYLALFLLSTCVGCAPQSGPDKTLGGAVVGAAWGMGAGAVVGNQVSASGEGVAVGAGLGALSGALTGAGYDITESQTMALSEKARAVDIQNNVNSQALLDIQHQLDNTRPTLPESPIHKILFDQDVSSLRSGASLELESIARLIVRNPGIERIVVRGHADDGGTPDYNQRLSEARARSVVGFLAAHGVDREKIKLESLGSTTPLASNLTPEGRQLNRRVDVVLQ